MKVRGLRRTNGGNNYYNNEALYSSRSGRDKVSTQLYSKATPPPRYLLLCEGPGVFLVEVSSRVHSFKTYEGSEKSFFKS